MPPRYQPRLEAGRPLGAGTHGEAQPPPAVGAWLAAVGERRGEASVRRGVQTEAAAVPPLCLGQSDEASVRGEVGLRVGPAREVVPRGRARGRHRLQLRVHGAEGRLQRRALLRRAWLLLLLLLLLGLLLLLLLLSGLLPLHRLCHHALHRLQWRALRRLPRAWE